MSNRKNQVGFSQRVRLEWLEQTANLVLAGNDKAAVKNALQEILKDKVSIGGQAARGNREKIITILMKVWLTAPVELEHLRVGGLELLKRGSQRDHISVHWGMVMAVYPFWAEVGAQVGRLLRLQGSVSAPQVQRRVREKYGERETVRRAARRILRSFLDWGVLGESGKQGVYRAKSAIPIRSLEMVAWMAEAFLNARFLKQSALKEITESPVFFPFDLKPPLASEIAYTIRTMGNSQICVDRDSVVLE